MKNKKKKEYRCPVLNVIVNKEEAEEDNLTSSYEGKKYYFCCDECKERFNNNPDKYAHDVESGFFDKN